MAKVSQKATSEPKISLSYLHDIADGSNEFMIEMIDIFLLQTPDYLQKIETAIAAEDLVMIAEISHKVRPTFAFIGVEEATQAMAEIETMARAGHQIDLIKSTFENIKPLMIGVFERLGEIRKELLNA